MKRKAGNIEGSNYKVCAGQTLPSSRAIRGKREIKAMNGTRTNRARAAADTKTLFIHLSSSFAQDLSEWWFSDERKRQIQKDKERKWLKRKAERIPGKISGKDEASNGPSCDVGR